jgi:hypothetical protein
VWIVRILSPEDDFWIRFPFALAGILTIPAVYFVLKDKSLSIWLSALVATFPLFVFWSRMARPYAMAGLFIVLARRNVWFYYLAILTTPVGLLGLNLVKWKERKWHYLALMALTIGVYLIRPDTQRTSGFLSLEFLLNAKRIWYVPLLTVLLYCGDYLLPKYFTRHTTNSQGSP